MEENNGQHKASPGPQENNGQRQIKDRGVVVGQKSGGEQQMDVPGCPTETLINTTQKV